MFYNVGLNIELGLVSCRNVPYYFYFNAKLHNRYTDTGSDVVGGGWAGVLRPFEDNCSTSKHTFKS